ncbi:MAG: hypothetical protein NZ580_04705, partial [Bacteroidia bacterium]|nr:hypothetical protein [Bacteroidia bacterium]
MKRIGFLSVIVVGILSLRAQTTGCTPCTQQNVNVTFSPPIVEVDQGQDLDVVVQFTLPDSAQVDAGPPLGTLTVYPNYAIFVDSL